MQDKKWFSQRVKVIEGCHIWQGYISPSGYGTIKFQGKSMRAHRIAYLLFVGTIPPDMLVCHKCDIKSCVNPEHLFLGTHNDNMRDMAYKGRHREQLKTHCPKGHEYTIENTAFYTGGRQCKTCSKQRRHRRTR